MWGTGVMPLARMLLAASGWLAVLAVDLLPAAAPLRLAAVGAFVLLGPGTALLLPLRPVLTGRHGPAAPDRSERIATVAESWMIAVMLSASALVLVAVGLMLANAFSASTTLFILSVTTSAAAVFPALGGAPRPEAEDPEESRDAGDTEDSGPGD